MTKQTARSNEPTDLFANAIEAQARFTAMAWHFNATVMEEAFAFNSEVFDFYSQRIGADVAVARALGKCSTLEQAMETFGTFQQKAVDDYTCEAAKIAALNTHVSDAIATEVAEDAQAIAKGLPQKAA